MKFSKVTYILCFLIEGTRNERKVLATSPRSDLCKYKSGISPSKAPKSMKRPCEDEPEVNQVNYLNSDTCINVLENANLT